MPRPTRTPLAMLCLLAAMLGACGNIAAPAQRFEFFDLGLIEPAEPLPTLAPSRVEVRAPSWLSSGAMQYRMDYRPPAQRDAYTQSRWAAEPAEMLRLSLDRALTAQAVPENGCRLRIELDEFVQVFENERDSHAWVVVRASLLAPRNDVELARRVLVVRERAPTPDASGGVIAHRRATRRLAADIATWLTGLDPVGGQGLNTAARCKRQQPA